MQVKKSDIKEKILEISKAEFMEHGYKDASMRTIAKKTGVSLGNIYNYYKNKDAIFSKVVAPPMIQLKKLNEMFMDDYFFDLNIITHKMKALELQYSIEFLNQYRDELNLIFFKSYGSSLQNYKDEWIDENTRVSIKWVNKFNRLHRKNIQISEFFTHYLNSSFVNFVAELLMHDIDEKDMELYLTEYYSFYEQGWKKIME